MPDQPETLTENNNDNKNRHTLDTSQEWTQNAQPLMVNFIVYLSPSRVTLEKSLSEELSNQVGLDNYLDY